MLFERPDLLLVELRLGHMSVLTAGAIWVSATVLRQYSYCAYLMVSESCLERWRSGVGAASRQAAANRSDLEDFCKMRSTCPRPAAGYCFPTGALPTSLTDFATLKTPASTQSRLCTAILVV